MIKLKQIFDFYLHASIHVSLATVALVNVTYIYAMKSVDIEMVIFVFFSTLSSYNLIKYGGYVCKNTKFTSYKNSLKAIIVLTVLSLIISGLLFLLFNLLTQILILIVTILIVLYVVPLKKGFVNLRNFSGIKIFIVSLCWAIVTLLVPLAEEHFLWDVDVLIKFFQRFILVLLLLLIFEINDLKHDDAQLKTMPQTFGISNTKNSIYALCVWFFILDILKKATYATQDLVNALLMIIVALFTFYVSPKRSAYYTLFWVESVPIIWWILLVVIGSGIQINS